MYRIRVTSLVVLAALAFIPLPAAAQGGGAANNLQALVDALAARVTTLEAAVTALQAALANETAARQAADTTLQSNITAEVNNRISAVAAEIAARQAADTTLQSNITAEVNNRISAVAAESAARQAADTTLQVQIDKLNGNITAADLEGTYNFYFVATALDSDPNTITSYFYAGTITLESGGIGQLDISASGRQLTEQAPSLNWVAANVGDDQAGNISWVYSNGIVTITAGGDSNDLTPAAGGQVMVGVQGGPPGNNQAILVLTRQPF